MTIYSLAVLLSNLELLHCSMSSSNFCFLTCIQVSQESGNVVWYSHLYKNVLQFVVIHSVKGFGIVNEAEVDDFSRILLPVEVGNLISGSSAFSESSLYIWKFSGHILLKPGLENFEHYFASMWDKCNCAVVWTFFSVAFLWDWTCWIDKLINPLEHKLCWFMSKKPDSQRH